MAGDLSDGSDALSPEQELEEELEEMFDMARVFVEQTVMSGSNVFDDSSKLRLYALFKQATVGPCNAAKPYLWDVKGKAKWSAWHALGSMSAEEAKIQYVDCVQQVAGTDLQQQQQPGGTSTSGGGAKAWGPVFSRLAVDDSGGIAAAAGAAEGAEHEPEGSLLQAARAGDLGVARAALEACPGAVREVDAEGCTALHLAADRGRGEVVALLLAAGADVNARDGEGLTALHYAAICEHRQVCELLLEHGADASLKDDAGETPVDAGPSTWAFWPPA